MSAVQPSAKLLVIRYLLFDQEKVAFEGDVKQQITINYRQITLKQQEEI